MTRTIHVLQVVVVPAARIGVPHQEADGRPEGDPIEDATEPFHPIALLAGSPQWCAARASAVQLLLNGLQVQLQPRGTAIDHTTDGRSVALTERGEPEEQAEGVAGHAAKVLGGEGAPAWVRASRSRSAVDSLQSRYPRLNQPSTWSLLRLVLTPTWTSPHMPRKPKVLPRPTT